MRRFDGLVLILRWIRGCCNEADLVGSSADRSDGRNRTLPRGIRPMWYSTSETEDLRPRQQYCVHSWTQTRQRCFIATRLGGRTQGCTARQRTVSLPARRTRLSSRCPRISGSYRWVPQYLGHSQRGSRPPSFAPSVDDNLGSKTPRKLSSPGFIGTTWGRRNRRGRVPFLRTPHLWNDANDLPCVDWNYVAA